MNLEDTEHIRALFQKYLKGQCSRQETEQLMAYFGQDKLPELLRDFIKEELHNESKPESEALKRVRAYSDRVGEHLRREINPHIKTSTRIVHRRLSGKWHAFAAAILLLVVAGVSWMYIGRSFKGVPEVVSNARYGNDVSPGSNRAILTLANGNKIDLDSAVTGTLVTLKGINIVKKETGLISYEAEKRDDHAWKPEYNTITTPRGRQYQLILPDGKIGRAHV